VQDTLIRAFTRFSRYQHGNLHGWLMTIMTNTAIDTHRSRQRRPTEVLTADLPESPTMRHGASSHWRSPKGAYWNPCPPTASWPRYASVIDREALEAIAVGYSTTCWTRPSGSNGLALLNFRPPTACQSRSTHVAPVLDKVMDGEAEARDDCRRGRRWEGEKRFRRADDRSRVGVRAIL